MPRKRKKRQTIYVKRKDVKDAIINTLLATFFLALTIMCALGFNDIVQKEVPSATCERLMYGISSLVLVIITIFFAALSYTGYSIAYDKLVKGE